MGLVWGSGWRKLIKAAGKTLFLKKEPAGPYTEKSLGPHNAQGSWPRAQRGDL